MNLSKDLREFIELLNSANVKYLVVGGHAVAYHGHPRFTGDIDFFIERSRDNAARLERVVRDFGFAGLGLKAADFLESQTVVQLGRPPHRIDLVTSIDAVEFDEAWRTKVSALFGGLPVSLISRELLIRNKQAVRRAQDLADLERLSDEG